MTVRPCTLNSHNKYNNHDAPQLVDLLTPEFCLKINDTFVNATRCAAREWLAAGTTKKLLFQGGQKKKRSTDELLTWGQNN